MFLSVIGVGSDSQPIHRRTFMSCALIGQIAVTVQPAMTHIEGRPAVRVSGYLGHDVILLNPDFDFYDRLKAIIDCVRPEERHSLVWDVPCTCEPVGQLRSA